MPAKDQIEWPYVALLVGIVVMVTAALHLLSVWVAYVIFAVLWIGFAIRPKSHQPDTGGAALRRERLTDAKTDALSKVARVTLVFWVIKILATTLGETGDKSDTAYTLLCAITSFPVREPWILHKTTAPSFRWFLHGGQWRVSTRERMEMPRIRSTFATTLPTLGFLSNAVRACPFSVQPLERLTASSFFWMTLFHGNAFKVPVAWSLVLVFSPFTSSGFFPLKRGSPTWALTTCSS